MARKGLLVLVMKDSIHEAVRDEPLGDGIRIVKLRTADLDTIRQQNTKNMDQWDFAYSGGGTPTPS